MALPIIAPLVGAGLVAGASYLGGRQRNIAQAKEAQKQRDFQERMSSTAYQRAVKDMRLSGINPMLAFAQGGATTPGGAQASVEDVAAPAVSSAMHARRLSQEIRNMKAVENRDQSAAELSRTQQQVAASEKILKDKQFWMLSEQIKGAKHTNALLKYQLPGAANVANVESNLGPWGSYLNYILKTVKGRK